LAAEIEVVATRWKLFLEVAGDPAVKTVCWWGFSSPFRQTGNIDSGTRTKKFLVVKVRRGSRRKA
jgi:hypothetical protein